MKVISFLGLLMLVSCGSRDQNPTAPIDSKNFDYQQCFYESETYSNRNIKGKGQVSITFILMPDGKIEDERIAATDFKDANFHACLLETTRALELPPNTVETKITKVINFKLKVKMNY
jgi:hypothetical protein